LPPFDTKKFVFTDGYVNDIIAGVENGSVIRLEPRDDWQFGPPGKKAIDLGRHRQVRNNRRERVDDLGYQTECTYWQTEALPGKLDDKNRRGYTQPREA